MALTGPSEVSFEGLRNGVIKTTIKGLKLKSDFKVEKSILNGYGDIETSGFSLSGFYDPVSGRVYGLSTDDSFNVDVDFDFNSPIDFLISGLDKLLFGFLDKKIDGELSKLERSAKTSIERGLNASLNNAETVVFGLDQHIPNGIFIYQGKDYRDELIDGIKGLISGEKVKIKLSHKFYGSPPRASSSSASRLTTIGNNSVEVIFNNTFSFKVYKKFYWEKMWRFDPDDCNPGCPQLP